MIIDDNLGKLDHDLTSRPNPGIMVTFGEIISKWQQDSGLWNIIICPDIYKKLASFPSGCFILVRKSISLYFPEIGSGNYMQCQSPDTLW